MRLALPCLVAALAAATPAAAQTVLGNVASDLDRDGRAETFTLIDSGEGYATLRIDYPGGSLTSPDIAWVGGMDGQMPFLAIAPNGSVQVVALNDAIGRDRWELTLTIAYRNGDYRIAGYTYGWRDTLDIDNNGVCDVNLLSGRGEVSVNGGPKISFPTQEFATPVSSWSSASFGPNESCFGY